MPGTLWLRRCGPPGALPGLAPWFGLYAGAGLLAIALAYAAMHPAGNVHVHLFWLGMLLFFIPACLRLCRSQVAYRERLALVVALGIFDVLPKYLLSPDHLLFADELAHYRQAVLTTATGRLFQPNPLVPIVRVYPGLHALTALLEDLSGLNTFQLAIVLLVTLHAAALLGVFVAAEGIEAGYSTGKPVPDGRIASLAALFYSINPGFLYFDAQYAYESLAIVLFIWTLAALVRLEAAAERSERLGWLCVALVTGGACIITHHVTSYILLATSMLIGSIAVARYRHGPPRPKGTRYPMRRDVARSLGVFALFMLIGIAAWTLAEARSVVAYLGPLASAVAGDTLRLLRPHAALRPLFSGSAAPYYERMAAFASPVIAAVGALLGLWLLPRARRRHTCVALGLYGLGLAYFASLPLMLTQGGNEAARRSWSFSYLGLSFLLAPAIPWLLRQADLARTASRRTRMRMTGAIARPAAATVIAGLLAVMLVGNTAMNTNATYRFPGAVIYGSDTRMLTAELLETVRWFDSTYGTGQLVIADRDSSLAFAGFGDEWTATGWSGLPIWQLYLSSAPPSAALLRTLHRERYGYLIIDRRMVQFLPWIGFYLTVGEPSSHQRTRPPPRAAIERYEQLPWTIKIYQTDHLEVYRLDYAALSLRWIPRRAAGVHRGSAPAATCCIRVVPSAARAASGSDHASPPRAGQEVAHG